MIFFLKIHILLSPSPTHLHCLLISVKYQSVYRWWGFICTLITFSSGGIHPAGEPALKLYTCENGVSILLLSVWMTVSCSAVPSSRPPVLTQRILCASAALACCTVERGSSPARPVAGASSERPVIKSMVNALKSGSSERLSGIRLWYR